MRRLAPSSSRNSASAIDSLAVAARDDELARLREALARGGWVTPEARRSGLLRSSAVQSAVNSRAGSGWKFLQGGEVGRREAAGCEHGDQGLGFHGVRTPLSARAPARAARARRRACRTPSTARCASSASALGPEGTTAAGREPRARADARPPAARVAPARRRAAPRSAPLRATSPPHRPAAAPRRTRTGRTARRGLREPRARPAARPASARAASAPSAARRARAMAHRRRPAGAGGRARRAAAVARRRGIEHDAAGDGGLRRGGAHDHAVTARGRHELPQPQLGEARRSGRQRHPPPAARRAHPRRPCRSAPARVRPA